MADTTNFSVRMDSEIKRQCESMFGELGMNLTTAINVFLRQSLRAGGFPFEVRLEQPKLRKKYTEDADDVEAIVNSLTGAIPDTGKSLEEYRSERLKKYENPY